MTGSCFYENRLVRLVARHCKKDVCVYYDSHMYNCTL